MLATIQKHAEKRINRKISEQRTDYAKYLLVFTNDPVEKIAADCGWVSERVFSAAFQKIVGVTPTHYRNWHQG